MNFAEQMIKAFCEKFAEDTKLRTAVANKIIKLLAKAAETNEIVKIEDFQDVLWRLKEKIQKGIDFTKLLNKSKDDEIETVINEMIQQKELWKVRNGNFSETESTVWLFEEMLFADKNLKGGDVVSIQVMREGKWKHPLYGEVVVSKKTMKDVKKNFDSKERGIDLAVDENHEGNHKALGWFKELFFEGVKDLFAKIELTKQGAKLLNEGAYKYFSPEIVFSKVDEESGKSIKNLLIGGAFTNRPFFKAMKALTASEESGVAKDSQKENGKSKSFALYFNTDNMKKFLALLTAMAVANKFSENEIEALKVSFSELSEDEKSPELVKAFDETIEKAEADEKTPEEIAEEKRVADEKVAEDKKNEGKTPEEIAAEEKKASEDKNKETPSDEEIEKAEKIEATEVDGKVSLDFAEYSAMKKVAASHAKLVKQAKSAALEKSFSEMNFSEENKIGVVLPKAKAEVLKFAESLSDKQSTQFLKILQNLQTVAAAEIGTDKPGTAKVFSNDKVSFLQNMGFSEEESKEILEKEEEKSK